MKTDYDPLGQEFFRRCLALRPSVKIDMHLTIPFGRTAVRLGDACRPDCLTFYFEKGERVQLCRYGLSPREMSKNVDRLVEEATRLLPTAEAVA